MFRFVRVYSKKEDFTTQQKPQTTKNHKRSQSDGLRPVIPSECEGSKKDISRSLP